MIRQNRWIDEVAPQENRTILAYVIWFSSCLVTRAQSLPCSPALKLFEKPKTDHEIDMDQYPITLRGVIMQIQLKVFSNPGHGVSNG